MILAWVVFPLVLTALTAGCGLLASVACRRTVPGALIPVAGLALIVVVTQFLALADRSAGLITPACVAMAAAGFALARPLPRPDGWAVAAAAALFAVYAAPIVLSGEATFAGYIRLDDTATWLAITDRLVEHGRDLGGLAPSSYEATLTFNLADGYPIGAFLAFGGASRLLGEDPAWLIQPYMAWLAALLALALWELARPLIGSRRLRALVAVLAAQSALLFGYYLWGGVKEVAGAALIASAAALVAGAAARGFTIAALAPLAVVSSALIGVLSGGGAIWLVPGIGLACLLATLRLATGLAARRAVAITGALVLLTMPVWIGGGLLPPTSSPLTDDDARGNLLGSLDPAQVAGIWPAGDFRIEPVAPGLAYVLVAIVVVAAATGLVLAWRSRATGVVLYVAGALGSALVIYLVGSPWVGAKALATAAPAVPLAAGIAAAWLLADGNRVTGVALIVAVGGGIVWSNVLAYRDVNLAPREQLAELEEIGDRIAGQGPALMTEYQPYGVRHFLRKADPEGASELRRRPIPLSSGQELTKGETADTDALDPAALLVYRTLVLRRSPSQSRPPGPYRVVWRGEYYDVWQRDLGAPDDLQRLALGGSRQPTDRPECRDVELLADRAGPGDRLVAARPRPVLISSLSTARYPRSWSTPGTRGTPVPRGEGRVEIEIEVVEPGRYEAWLGGTVRPSVVLSIDGRPLGAVRHQLQNQGQYTRLGAAVLGPGAHRVTIAFGGVDLHPGSGGAAGAVGPLVLSGAGPADIGLVGLDPSDSSRLCGRAWDWIELEPARG